MRKHDKGQIELERYPVGLSMPFGVSSGIKARRCQVCNRIYFTNQEEIIRCRKCKH